MNKFNLQKFIKEDYGWFLLIVLLASSLVFARGMNYSYTNWDDTGYTIDNPLLSPDTSLGTILTSFYAGNYHPLTILSYKLDTVWSGTIEAFHKTNILLHLLNIVLLFFITRLLRLPPWLMALVIVIFALHPMRIENVIWISGRKDVLSMFFALSSWTFYLLFMNSNKSAFMFACMLTFIAALLSKGSMAFLPIVFIASHHFMGRSLKYNLYINASMLVLSITAGITAIIAQSGEKAIFTTLDYGIMDRLVIISFAISKYLSSIIAPTGLSALYPYPSLEQLYTLAFLLPLALLFLLAFGLWKYRVFNKYVILGAIIFFASLAMYLQFLPVGIAYMADRYSYFAFIGAALLIGGIIVRFVPSPEKIGLGLACIALLAYSMVSYERIPVWKTSIDLWEDVHSNYPNHALVNNNLGAALKEAGQNKAALPYLDRALEINKQYPEAYFNRAQVLYFTKQYELALLDINRAVIYEIGNAEYYQTRASIYMKLNQREKAFTDFNTAIELNPREASYYNNRGILYKKYNRFASAIEDFSKAIEISPMDPVAYYSRANTYVQQGNFKAAIPDFTISIALQPDFGEAYYNRSFCYFSEKNYTAALQDYKQAVAYGLKSNDEYEARLKVLLKGN